MAAIGALACPRHPPATPPAACRRGQKPTRTDAPECPQPHGKRTPPLRGGPRHASGTRAPRRALRHAPGHRTHARTPSFLRCARCNWTAARPLWCKRTSRGKKHSAPRPSKNIFCTSTPSASPGWLGIMEWNSYQKHQKKKKPLLNHSTRSSFSHFHVDLKYGQSPPFWVFIGQSPPKDH